MKDDDGDAPKEQPTEPARNEHGEAWKPIMSDRRRPIAWEVTYPDGRVAVVPMCID
jgi:hypothetical protein